MSDPMHVEMARRVRRRRIELHLTQAEVAEQAEVGLSTVIRIERGESTQVRTLRKVAEVLDVPLGDLMTEAS